MTLALSFCIGFIVFQFLCIWRREVIDYVMRDQKLTEGRRQLLFFAWLAENALPGIAAFALALWML